jgi:hypothetical protein
VIHNDYSLRDLGVLCVSAVSLEGASEVNVNRMDSSSLSLLPLGCRQLNRRDAENAEGAQRLEI